MQTTVTFVNGQQQDLQLFVTHLHASALLILGFSWLCTTNSHVNWQHLTLHFDQQTLEHLEPILFDVTTSVSTANHPHTPSQLCSKSAWSFIIDVQLSDCTKVFTACRATGMFFSDQLDLHYNYFKRPLELQLLNGKLTTTRPITRLHSSSIVLDDGLWFLVNLLITQLLKTTVTTHY
ncbi:hypothetical protein C0993_002166 [Termitomyces sp. T159_Od127]|nr:hypothetical protein C0993_002166 [Termitomyces sp. T159_Od127]